MRKTCRADEKPKALRLLLLALLALLLTTSIASAGEIQLSAAASLKEVVTAIVAEYSKTHPGTHVSANFAGSGTLAKQIANGAPADIFISAGSDWTDYLKAEKAVDASSITAFTFNSLVFVTSAGKTAATMNDLIKLDTIALGSPKSVPAGEYAMEAISKAGLAKDLQKRLVYAKDVREALLYAERGDVDGAFVYKTDALLVKQAKIRFTVPQQLHARIIYPMALTTGGRRNSEAVAFYTFLQGNVSKKLLSKYGFAVR